MASMEDDVEPRAMSDTERMAQGDVQPPLENPLANVWSRSQPVGPTGQQKRKLIMSHMNFGKKFQPQQDDGEQELLNQCIDAFNKKQNCIQFFSKLSGDTQEFVLQKIREHAKPEFKSAFFCTLAGIKNITGSDLSFAQGTNFCFFAFPWKDARLSEEQKKTLLDLSQLGLDKALNMLGPGLTTCNDANAHPPMPDAIITPRANPPKKNQKDHPDAHHSSNQTTQRCNPSPSLHLSAPCLRFTERETKVFQSPQIIFIPAFFHLVPSHLSPLPPTSLPPSRRIMATNSRCLRPLSTPSHPNQ
jgi:hypothetical protein